MIMINEKECDSSLILRFKRDQRISLSDSEIQNLLGISKLVGRLTSNLQETPLFYVWRIIALSEIPFSERLKYTENLIDRIYQTMSTPFGFSLSGDKRMFLPCYNAMLVSALSKLGRANDVEVQNGVDWIMHNQPVERGRSVNIKGFDFKKYGGCFNNVPCYIGVAKSIKALHNYQRATPCSDVSNKIDSGLEYILDHNLVYRLSDGLPINGHILDLSFPESYHLNIVEILSLISETKYSRDPRVNKALSYVLSRCNSEDKTWKITYRYKASGYECFDMGRGTAKWLSYVLFNAISTIHNK